MAPVKCEPFPLCHLQPRIMNRMTNMGMGMPKAHRSIQPTFPFSFLNIFITVFFLALPWTVTINSPLTGGRFDRVFLSVARPLRRTFLIAQFKTGRPELESRSVFTARRGMMDVYLYWERSPHRSKKYRVHQIAQRSPLRA